MATQTRKLSLALRWFLPVLLHLAVFSASASIPSLSRNRIFHENLDGIGGLEATVDETSGTATPLVSNAFGDVVGIASSGTMVWSPARIGSYGLLPGSPAAPILDGTSTVLSQALLWRGFRIDPTGFYYLGARYYDPAAGRFLSPDPLGHGASMDLYSYANGDPVNRLDPDGRFGKQAGSFAYNGLGIGQGLSALSSNLDSLTNDSIGNDNSLLAYSAAAGSSIAGSLSSLLTPKVYVDGASQFAGNIGTVYNNSRTTGESVLAASMLATGYGLTSWNVGAIYQGVNNVNVLSGQPLGGWGARTQSILSGVAGTAFAAAGVAAPIVSAGTPIFGADDTMQVGYHATNPANVQSILNNGFYESQSGRLGGGGIYVNNTQEGAMAEYMAHNPGGSTPTVLQVQYNPGLNYQISLPTVPSTTGPLPFAADTITAPSVRLPGTLNTIIRNGSATPINP